MIVSKKSAIAIAAVLAASVEAHGRGHSLMFPRRGYSYHHRRSPSIDMMSDMFSLPVYFNSLFQQQQQQISRRAQSDLTYHVRELPTGETELTVDVPGVSAKDLTVELVEDGTMLHVSGSRRHHDSVTEFDQLFRLNKDVDADNLSVRLADGVLTVTAPKREKVVKKLPIIVAEENNDAVEVEAQVVSDTEEANGDGEEERQEVDGMTITTDEKE